MAKPAEIPHALQEARTAREWCRTGVARIVREGAGLSRGDVARALGVTETCVWLWETGARRPRVEVAGRYAALMRGMMQPPGAAEHLR